MVVAPVCGRHIGVILGHDQTDGHSMEMMKCKKGRRGRACERLTYATQCSYQKHICAIPLFLQEAQLCGPLVLVRGTAICDLCAFCQRHSCMQPFVQIRGTAIQSSTRGTAMQSLTRGTAMQSLTRGTAMQSLTRGTAMQFLCSDQRRGLARKDAGHLGHAVHMLYSLLCWAPWTCSAYALLPPVLGALDMQCMLFCLLCWAPWTCSACSTASCAGAPWTCSAYALLPPVLGALDMQCICSTASCAGHLGHAVHMLYCLLCWGTLDMQCMLYCLLCWGSTVQRNLSCNMAAAVLLKAECGEHELGPA